MRINLFTYLLLLTALTTCCGTGPEPDDPVVPEEGERATVYTTTAAGVLFQESSVPLCKPGDVNFYKVKLNGESYQSVDGFGMAITQASCYNLLKMNADDRAAFLREIFCRTKGMGSSLVRDRKSVV